MQRGRRSCASSMRCIVGTVPATTRPGSTSRPFRRPRGRARSSSTARGAARSAASSHRAQGDIVAHEHWCSSGFRQHRSRSAAQEARHPPAHRHRPHRAHVRRGDRSLRRRARLRGHGGQGRDGETTRTRRCTPRSTSTSRTTRRHRDHQRSRRRARVSLGPAGRSPWLAFGVPLSGTRGRVWPCPTRHRSDVHGRHVDRSPPHAGATVMAIAAAPVRPTEPRGRADARGGGTNTSCGPLKQIDAGLLNVGYAEAGPASGPPGHPPARLALRHPQLRRRRTAARFRRATA